MFGVLLMHVIAVDLICVCCQVINGKRADQSRKLTYRGHARLLCQAFPVYNYIDVKTTSLQTCAAARLQHDDIMKCA